MPLEKADYGLASEHVEDARRIEAVVNGLMDLVGHDLDDAVTLAVNVLAILTNVTANRRPGPDIYRGVVVDVLREAIEMNADVRDPLIRTEH